MEILTTFILTGLVFIYVYINTRAKKKLIKEKNSLESIVKDQMLEIESIQETSSDVDFLYTKQGLSFLDDLIKTKYTFYMYSELMPTYLDSKVPEKSAVLELKEKIYVSVVGGLTQEVKKALLLTFTEKGIRIYINEKIMIHINETDFKISETGSQSFKDINPRRMAGLIP